MKETTNKTVTASPKTRTLKSDDVYKQNFATFTFIGENIEAAQDYREEAIILIRDVQDFLANLGEPAHEEAVKLGLAVRSLGSLSAELKEALQRHEELEKEL